MTKRPTLSNQTFLAHVFSPKRNPQPTGLRKQHLSGTRGGRIKGRLAAFNRMSPVNQELLKRSGLREDYLKGTAKIADAKESLRSEAVNLGVAKPRRPSAPRVPIVTDLDRRVAGYLKYRLRGLPKTNSQTIDANVPRIPAGVKEDVLTWDYTAIKYAGRDGSEYETMVNGKAFNPFWYH
jgi:hypothetical protein